MHRMELSLCPTMWKTAAQLVLWFRAFRGVSG